MFKSPISFFEGWLISILLDGVLLSETSFEEVTWSLVQVFDIAADIGVFMDGLPISFEVHHIDLIKSDKCHEESNICLCQLVTNQVSAFAEYAFNFVESRKELPANGKTGISVQLPWKPVSQ